MSSLDISNPVFSQSTSDFDEYIKFTKNRDGIYIGDQQERCMRENIIAGVSVAYWLMSKNKKLKKVFKPNLSGMVVTYWTSGELPDYWYSGQKWLL